MLRDFTTMSFRTWFSACPPYANGHLHAGHALNQVLKDIVVKYRNHGRAAAATSARGGICHGLPIEQAVEKRLTRAGRSTSALSPATSSWQACREYALEFIGHPGASEAKRLGIFARWDEPYRTLTFDYEAQEIRELATFADEGCIYRRKKPVYWCIDRPDRAGRGGGRVRGPRSALGLRGLPDRRRRSGRPDAREARRARRPQVTSSSGRRRPGRCPPTWRSPSTPSCEYVFYDLRAGG